MPLMSPDSKSMVPTEPFAAGASLFVPLEDMSYLEYIDIVETERTAIKLSEYIQCESKCRIEFGKHLGDASLYHQIVDGSDIHILLNYCKTRPESILDADFRLIDID
jgi:hypothetical protein